VTDRIIEIITAHSMADEKIIPEDRLADLGIDSLRLTQMVIELEEKFNVRFDSSKLNPTKLKTVWDIVSLTEEAIQTT